MDDLHDQLSALMFRDTISTGDIFSAQVLKRRYFPAGLYKYRGCSQYSFENLRTKSLFCATADTFNDPYDSAIKFTIPSLLSEPDVVALLDQMDDEPPMVKEALLEVLSERNSKTNKEMVDQFNKFIQSSYKICSLSERVDSLLMWGHYGANHTGFAMEYDFQSLPADDVMALCLWPVFYGDTIFDVSTTINMDQGEGFNNLFAIASAMHKAADWSYEREWRIVIADGPTTPSRSFLAPLKAVHLGSKISAENEKTIIDIARAINVPAYKMQLSQHEFKMESVPLQQKDG
ncbi:DUF2971 domain-containing protein [Pseudomonas lutea]|uniref:DUF2971 domain-containing protein n=1 Tax=Pseudomonas lutea TaxID=243924 RepID=UPI00068DC022|nr:DUF2971 domain-containing protein [Pseudomonas lutea]